MGEVSYRPLVEDMTWSYSRIGAFDECPYRFFLRYIKHYKDGDRFYASYGSFMHKLIECYYRGLMTKEEMLDEFLTGFSEQVKGTRPKQSIVDSYIKSGIEYLKSFEPFPFNMIEVEKKVEFELDGIKMIGFIDYLGEKDGELYIVDNKSRNLKPRSNRKTPTKNDMEIDEMLRQLYLYAAAVKKEYGKFPKALCLNCFKNKTFIVELFNKEAYNEACEWAKTKVSQIKDADDFYPNCDFFSCTYICGVSEHCCYDEINQGGRRKG